MHRPFGMNVFGLALTVLSWVLIALIAFLFLRALATGFIWLLD
jgi:hypothetical protein